MRPTRIALLAVVLLLGTLAQPALSPTHTLALHGDTHHPQGIELDERSLWVTSVDKVGKRGFLQEFSLSTGELVRTTDVTATRDRFHPGGLSREGDAFWLPVAEYRRESSAVIQRRNLRTFALEFEFEVTDHIGCL